MGSCYTVYKSISHITVTTVSFATDKCHLEGLEFDIIIGTVRNGCQFDVFIVTVRLGAYLLTKETSNNMNSISLIKDHASQQ
jgi:hypothetical protein